MRCGGLKLVGFGAIALACAACEPSREELVAEHEATLER